MPEARIEADLGANVRASWVYSGARGSQEGPVRRGLMGWVSTVDLLICHSMLPLLSHPGCFLKGKAGGSLWGWLFLVPLETDFPIPSDHQSQVSLQ